MDGSLWVSMDCSSFCRRYSASELIVFNDWLGPGLGTEPDFKLLFMLR